MPVDAGEHALSEARLEQIRRISAELFPGHFEIQHIDDPEDATHSWWAVCVRSAADPAAIRQLRKRWHEAVDALAPGNPTVFALEVWGS